MEDSTLREMLRDGSADLMAEPYVTKNGQRAWVILTMRDHGKRVADVYTEADARLIVAAVNSLPVLLDRLARAEGQGR